MPTYRSSVSNIAGDGEPIPRRELPDCGSEHTNAAAIEAGNMLGKRWASDPDSGVGPARLAHWWFGRAVGVEPDVFSPTPAIDVARATTGAQNVTPGAADSWWKTLLTDNGRNTFDGSPCDMLSEVCCREFCAAVTATVFRAAVARADRAEGIRTSRTAVDARVDESARQRRRSLTPDERRLAHNAASRRRRAAKADAGTNGCAATNGHATNGASSEQLDLFNVA